MIAACSPKSTGTVRVPSDRLPVAERLRHIVENCDAAISYVEGLSFDAFTRDQMRIDAVERCLERIAEAASRVGSGEMARVAPDIPFHEVKGLGNALRHEYHKLDLATIWSTVCDDLPPLRIACERTLGR